jgi:hypothetical protein
MEKYLVKIYQDFLKEKDRWCHIGNSQFSNSSYKNYDDKQYEKNVIEQYYLLRFAPFYLEEYFEIYLQFLQMYEDGNLKVLSVGVGTGLDFWGLADAVIHLNKTVSIDYMGIDLVDWKYRLKEIRFLQKSIEELTFNDFQNFTYGNANVIIFPKSIIEIDKETLVKFANFVTETNIKNVWFLISYIKKGSKISGLDKFDAIYNVFVENKYNLYHGDINEYYESDEKQSRIFYPIDYRGTWMKSISEHCAFKCNQAQISSCNLSGQYPMLKKEHIAFGIYNFRR